MRNLYDLVFSARDERFRTISQGEILQFPAYTNLQKFYEDEITSDSLYKCEIYQDFQSFWFVCLNFPVFSLCLKENCKTFLTILVLHMYKKTL